MDLPDWTSDDHRVGPDDGFRRIVASQPPSSPPPYDSRFVKRVEVPELKLSSLASKFKAVSLRDRGPVGHFVGF